MRGPRACPQVEGLVGPPLVPVGWESRLALRVQNLQHFQVSIPAGGGWGQLMAFRLLTAYTPQGLPASYHCWLELPGQLQRLPASLEEVAGDSGLIHCQAQQVGRCPTPTSLTCRWTSPAAWACPGPSGARSPPLAHCHSQGLLWAGHGWEMCPALGGGVIYAGKSFLEEAGGGLERF